MGLFSRRKDSGPDRPFWEVPPFTTTNPQVLYEHGISCVTQSDGPGMMSVGWALWDMVGLNQHQAWDFLNDGYQNWENAGASSVERVAFLTALLDRLRVIQPEISPSADLSSLAPSVVAPVSRYYTARCWAASELLEAGMGADGLSAEVEQDLFVLLDSTHRGFMPPRTLGQFAALQRNRGVAAE